MAPVAPACVVVAIAAPVSDTLTDTDTLIEARMLCDAPSQTIGPPTPETAVVVTTTPERLTAVVPAPATTVPVITTGFAVVPCPPTIHTAWPVALIEGAAVVTDPPPAPPATTLTATVPSTVPSVLTRAIVCVGANQTFAPVTAACVVVAMIAPLTTTEPETATEPLTNTGFAVVDWPPATQNG